jgi:hypothetical protein
LFVLLDLMNVLLQLRDAAVAAERDSAANEGSTTRAV